ncbi:MAG: exo-beta-N-acetylmuramidase NamZ domain-containing protein, partial [Acidobacteriota bacterium]
CQWWSGALRMTFVAPAAHSELSGREMFERYTEMARRVIFFARYEASQFSAPMIEPEHLLLGLSREDQPLFARFFTDVKQSLLSIREKIEQRNSGRDRILCSVELPLAPDTKLALTYAYAESETLGDRHIGTEHLLLGLLRLESSMAAQILLELGLRVDDMRDVLAEKLEAPRSYEPPSDRAKGKRRIVLGVERLLGEQIDMLRGARVGLVCNQASVDHRFRHAADLFHEHRDVNLTVLFGPQHGIRGDVQDNMIETSHAKDRKTGLPIYSLYSETREPTEEMLRDVDVIVFDLQDVGCRIYTFIYTLANCMRAAKKFGKKVIACDRPNPIGGTQVSGNVLDPAFASFVGQYPLPTRHGMTVGELARLFNDEFGIGCELECVPMEGWLRELWYDETDGPWVLPSPNMPTCDTAAVFPGAVHLEGTQMSEGRGTTRPFELVGAPYIDADRFADALAGLNLPGVYFRSCVFMPTFQKHGGRACGGVQIHVTDRESFEPVIAGIAVVKTAFDMYRDDFRWKEPPYEYEYERNPFDIISGTSRMREAIERGDSLTEIETSWQPSLEEFMATRQRFLLY